MGIKSKKILASVMACLTLATSGVGIVAYADAGTNETISNYLSGDLTGKTIPGSIIKGTENKDESTYDRTKYNYYLGSDNNYYYVLKESEETAVQSIEKANKSAQVENDVKDLTGGLGLEANTTEAAGALSGFMPFLSTLLGLMVILISVGMTIFSGFDLCYIAFPVFRNKCEESKQSGTGVMASNKKGANGETKLRFVSDDAQYAVTAADTVQSGKNPFVIYFGKRLLSYIILAILLFILLTGNITIFTDLALKAVSGILEIIQGI